MKRNAAAARETEADAGLDRIMHLAEQLSRAPVNSRRHRSLSAALRVEAKAYRKGLDLEQATARQLTTRNPTAPSKALPVVMHVLTPRSRF